MRRPGLIWLAILAGTALCVAVMFDNREIVIGTTDSDMLWPATFIWDVTTRADGWRGHSLSRLPSLVPDVLVWGPLWLATRSVLWTSLLYGVAQLSAFVAVGGWIASRLAGRAWVVGAAAVFAVTAALIGLALNGAGAGGMTRIVVLPIVHFGPMLLALLGGALAAQGLGRSGAAWAIAGVAAAVFLSDRLLIVEFVLPLVFATAVLGAAGRIRLSRAIVNVVWAVLGVVAGDIVFQRLKHYGIQADPAPPIVLATIRESVARFFHDLPGLIALAPAVIVVIGVATLLFLGLGIWLLRRALPGRGRGDAEREFLWLFLGAAVAGSTVFTLCFYSDGGSMRYLAALWCGVAIVLGTAVAGIRGADRATGPVAGLAFVAALAAFVVADRGRVALLDWDSDIAQCVRKLRGPLDLHAGLAEYWVARPAEVALRWSTQIDQITDDGHAYPWNNDMRWFSESFADPKRPPDYDFVVMRRLEPDRIAGRLGKPDTVVPCADTAIWVYRDHAALYAKVAEGLHPLGGPRR